jgi:copper oxidase (laccase) domain-containing protein
MNKDDLIFGSDVDYIKEYQGHLPNCEHVNPVTFSSGDADIYMFGKPKNWKDDFYFHTQVISLLMQNKIEKIYFPDISSFTGEICEHDEFTYSTKVEKFGLEIFKNKKVEGLVVPNGSAIFLCTADCPVIIYHDLTNDVLIVAHAGLSSVIDKQKVLTSRRSRFNESVVESIIDYLDENIEETDDYEIFIVCGISYESFIYSPYDEVHGENNKKILEFIVDKYGIDAVPLGVDHGGISIQNIIKHQFIGWGFDENKIHIDEVDTCTDPRWHSHAEFVQKGGVDGRNGFLVIHK